MSDPNFKSVDNYIFINVYNYDVQKWFPVIISKLVYNYNSSNYYNWNIKKWCPLTISKSFQSYALNVYNYKFTNNCNYNLQYWLQSIIWNLIYKYNFNNIYFLASKRNRCETDTTTRPSMIFPRTWGPKATNNPWRR